MQDLFGLIGQAVDARAENAGKGLRQGDFDGTFCCMPIAVRSNDLSRFDQGADDFFDKEG
jgi:hypothetical protein